MNESAADVARLQSLLDRSATKGGPHLRRTFQVPEHAVTAEQLVRYWGDGKGFALATVTANGEPRVAPVGVLLEQAHLYVPTAGDSGHVAHIVRNPAVSLTHWVDDLVAIIIHGKGALIHRESADYPALAEIVRATWWRDLHHARNGAFLRIEADVLYSWAHDPSSFMQS